MFALAKAIGMPSTFVEIRHQTIHEPLPSLKQLRNASEKALVWIKAAYWDKLGDLDEARIAGEVKVEDGRISDDPWSQPRTWKSKPIGGSQQLSEARVSC